MCEVLCGNVVSCFQSLTLLSVVVMTDLNCYLLCVSHQGFRLELMIIFTVLCEVDLKVTCAGLDNNCFSSGFQT